MLGDRLLCMILGVSGRLVGPAAFKAVEAAVRPSPGGFDSHPLPYDLKQETGIDKVSVKVYHARNWFSETNLWAEEAPNQNGGVTQ